ncbi:MAG: ketoacyl-ACP synthase III, partial [Bacteroidota bacterium]
MQNAVLHSIGTSVPNRVVPNSYFDELLGEPVSEWLEENVHIYERSWLEENESVSDLAVDAARKALEHGGLQPKDIDLLIISTDTPEFISPSTASKVQYLTG